MTVTETPTPQPVTSDGDTMSGFLFALTAYLLWGFLPLFMKLLSHIPALEVVAHRVLWSVPIAGVVLLIMGRTADLKVALRTPRMMAMGALTASIISVNWLIYVWAITHNHSLEAAFGYYINPLLSIALGAVVLKEKLHPLQIAAIALAFVAVGILTWEMGGVPWVSVGLAVSWAFYAYLRKTLPVGPNQGFLLEVLILLPAALAYVVYLSLAGESHFGTVNLYDAAILMATGIVTAGPLMIYANGAKRLKLSTIGIMQYIAPTIIFLLAVFIFREPFSATKLMAFALIWLALVLYTLQMFRGRRRR